VRIPKDSGGLLIVALTAHLMRLMPHQGSRVSRAHKPAKHDGNPHGAHPVAIWMTRENSRGVTAVGNLKQVVVAKVRRAGATALVEKYRDVTQPVWNRVEMKYDLRSGEVRMKRFVEGEDRWQATLVPDSGTR
jgi:hypothetical protein